MVTVYYADLGRVDYLETFQLQKELAEMRFRGTLGSDVILLAEHHPAILFGRDAEKNSFSPEFLGELEKSGKPHREHLKDMGIAFHADMPYGGGAAYVGPGNLLVYPINDTSRLLRSMDISGYKQLVDRTILDVMQEFGINKAYIASGMSSETNRERRDVWYDIDGKSHKIAAKGIHMRSNIAYHGFQMYVSKEALKHFWIVNPCGYNHDQVSVISMEDVIGYEPDMEEVKSSVLRSIKKNFRYDHLESCRISFENGSVSIRKR